MFRLRVPAFGFQCPASGLGFGVLVGKILRYRISPDPRQDTGLLVPDGKYSGSGEDICSLQHVYNSTYWLKPRSPAHQQGPSMLTEAPRHIMLTAAYRQLYNLFRPCAP
ncbi:hypothetical protein F2Q68_00043865 [Brassica cretica]|uniref:Uncharacterized protein n=1 Tax=Brassica cretica TaxID=69181 RepID=A0A8S9LJI9_BRACR|nr:hypothetical protein F2Q68_00043865 [Brassica cretica]